MNLFNGLILLGKLAKQISNVALYFLGCIVANFSAILFASPPLLIKKLTAVRINPFTIKAILINLIPLSTFSKTSNHHIITFDIIFFFSEIILLLFHRLKDPRHTPIQIQI